MSPSRFRTRFKSRALTRKRPILPADTFERDPATGQPTGLLEEQSAMDLLASHIPPHSLPFRASLFEKVMQEASKYGVTSIQDNSVIDRRTTATTVDTIFS